MFGLTKDLEPESHRFFQRYSFPLISSSAVTSNKLHQTIQSVIRQRSRRRGRMLETSLWGRWGLERELNIPRFTHPQTNYYPTSSFSSYSDFLISSNTVGEYNCLHSFPGGCKSHTNAFCLTSPLGQTNRCCNYYGKLCKTYFPKCCTSPSANAKGKELIWDNAAPSLAHVKKNHSYSVTFRT